jgi:opacity protein-like surface antigen
MSRPRLLLAAALAAALAACAPTHEWVNPAVNEEARALDSRDCNAAAWDLAAQRRFMYGGYRGGGYGMGGTAWSQNNTLEALDRNRYFEDCMRLRGYTQQPIAPR